MAHDHWLIDLAEKVRRAKTQAQMMEIIDRLEDHYDAFAGPGQELIEDLLVQARRRLHELA